MLVWQALHFEGLYRYHIHSIQHLELWDYEVRLQFCRWTNTHLKQCPLILFTDEAQFTCDRVNNKHNTHSWSPGNPHMTVINWQNKFSINIWWGIIFNKLTGPHIFEHCLTGQMYLNLLQNECLFLLKTFLWWHNSVCTYMIQLHHISANR
jgi:hypothetical protein